MRKLLTLSLIGATAATADFAVLPAPAVAQQDRIAEIIVYGNDPCPRSTDDEVVVCARRPESERYRIPEKYRPGGTLQEKQSWTNKAKVLETVGDAGINTCSPVGPGGYTGCLTQVVREAREQRKQQAEDYTPEQ